MKFSFKYCFGALAAIAVTIVVLPEHLVISV
jgi:hypothetical protein